MTFTIDTGVEAFNPITLIPDWFLDIYDVIPDTTRVIHDYGYHLIGAIQNPKMLKTVRAHALAQWAFLRVLAETHPTVFDEFWTAYAELALPVQ